MFISKGLPQLLAAACRQILESHFCALPFALLCAGILTARLVAIPDSSWTLVSLIPALALLFATVARRSRGVNFPSTDDQGAAAHSFPVQGNTLLLGTGAFFFVLGLHITTDGMRLGQDFEPCTEVCSIHATVSKTLGTAEDFRILLLEAGYNQNENRTLPGCGRLFLRNNFVSLSAGDRIAFRSRIRKPRNRGNPGEFDWASYCRSDGIVWVVSIVRPDGIVLIRRGSRWNPSAVLFDTREAMRLFLDKCSGRYLARWTGDVAAKDVRTFLKGIILGDRSEIGYTVRSTFADSGLAHSLSASGVHVAIVALLALISVRVMTRGSPAIYLWVPLGKISALAAIPAMVTYCMLVGASAPAIRSTIMGVVFSLAILADRRWDSFNSLIVAAFVILLLYPLSLFAVDFQLSFVAVAGILLVAPPLQRSMHEALYSAQEQYRGVARGRIDRYSRRLLFGLALVLIVSVGATLAVTPLLIQVFHSLPVYTLFANVLADFLLTVALFFGLCGSMIGLFSSSLGSLVLFPADLCSYFTIKLAALVSAMPYSTLKVRHMTIVEWTCLWAVVCCVIWAIRQPSRVSLKRVAVASCVFAASMVVSSLWIGDRVHMRVTFLNVGKADAAFVEPRGSKGLLIDGGARNEYFDSGPSIILPFLWWSGIRTLDGILISHPQMDHMGGLLAVIPHARPARMWWNPVEPCPGFVKRILAEAWKNESQMLPADRTRPPVRIGAASICFLNRPCSPGMVSDPHGLNDATVVCRIECGRVACLFTGDLEAPGETELLASGMPLAAEVLKVGHHGSKTSTSRPFVEAVRPKVAIISCDYPLARGSPGAEVLDRLHSAGSQVFWTGKDGAVTVETDGKTLSVRTGNRTQNGRAIGHSRSILVDTGRVCR